MPDYDKTRPLTIDPVLVYSTFLGGNDWDASNDIAVDDSGNVYLTGLTDSTDFPTANPLQPVGGVGAAFVTKLDASGSVLLYSTYLGGNGADEGLGIAVDTSGNIYVAGVTRSTDFPLVNPIQASPGGGGESFVLKLNPDGSALIYSTYLGGSDIDEVSWGGIAVDAAGDAYVAGWTRSTDFPTANAIQPSYGGGPFDGFAAKFSSDGSSLVYSTYLGGWNNDGAFDIAVDGSGNSYVTGRTVSDNFHTTTGAFQTSISSFAGPDAFIAKLSTGGSSLIYSTYLGGDLWDEGFAIAADAAGNAYVSGTTNSLDFPTENPSQAGLGGSFDAFTAKLNTDGSALHYSTYLGGTSHDQNWDIAVDAANRAYLTGMAGAGFPLENPIQATYGGSTYDAFISAFSANGCTLLYSTYLGGSGDDIGIGAAVGPNANVYVAGQTDSADFPTANPMQPIIGGSWTDAFVAKLSPAAPAVSLCPTSLDFGGQVVDTTSAPKAATLTNTREAPLNLTSIAASGDFVQTNDCGGTVAAGAGCTISVTFTPTTVGPASGTLTITSDAADSPHHVDLAGNGVPPAPAVNLSQGNVNFGDQLVGTTSPTEAVTLGNTGSAVLTITSITETGDFDQTNTCPLSPATLGVGAECVFTITFTPTARGARTGAITIEDDAPGSPHTVALSGTGTDFSLSADPTSRTVTAGQSATYTLSVTPVSGFSQAVALSCSGTPQRAQCTVSPSSVTPDGTNVVTATVTVTTTARGMAAPFGNQRPPLKGPLIPPVPRPWARLVPLLMLAMWAALLLAAKRHRVRAQLCATKARFAGHRPALQWAAPLAGTMLCVLLWAACGGGDAAPPPAQPGTPAGTYTLTLTGTVDSVSRQTTVTLTVN